MLQNYFNYQYLNFIGIILFIGLGWLANKSDIAKDVLALLLIILLVCPVSFIVYFHITNESWLAAILCALIQIGLLYACYIFVIYMYKYHKSQKYIFWE